MLIAGFIRQIADQRYRVDQPDTPVFCLEVSAMPTAILFGRNWWWVGFAVLAILSHSVWSMEDGVVEIKMQTIKLAISHGRKIISTETGDLPIEWHPINESDADIAPFFLSSVFRFG